MKGTVGGVAAAFGEDIISSDDNGDGVRVALTQVGCFSVDVARRRHRGRGHVEQQRALMACGVIVHGLHLGRAEVVAVVELVVREIELLAVALERHEGLGADVIRTRLDVDDIVR
eukprot:scaffold79046_cov63-Phaeocystis_antarctica.AAC.1